MVKWYMNVERTVKCKIFKCNIMTPAILVDGVEI
jgi:hypothetical protein